jgi:hypothetical protein
LLLFFVTLYLKLRFACQADDVKAIAKTTNVGLQEVNKYVWEVRKLDSANMRMTKFVEAIWRFVFYSLFCILGIKALFYPETVSWVINTDEHWINWPYQGTSPAVNLFYQIQLGSYLHQLMWTEISRSDALEMILHHVITITVVLFSFLTGFTRIGASIFLAHDLADIWLEMGKCFVYISRAKDNQWAKVYCDVFFVIFAITFAITRLYIYPRYLLSSLLFDSVNIMGHWPGHYAYAGLLLGLQGLHIFWFCLILGMVFRLMTTGIEKDERSDDEDMEAEALQVSDAKDPGSNDDIIKGNDVKVARKKKN